LEFIAALKDLAKIDLPDQVIVDAWNALLLDFPPERIELLRSLKNRYSLFLFSNTNALHHAHFHNMFRRDFGGESMDDLFKKAYYSQVMKMRKPDKASFEFIIRENKLDPAETLFVDDALINIEGAKSAELIAHYLAPGTTILDLDL
jgi:putative hydrolase of the HAD superfamily